MKGVIAAVALGALLLMSGCYVVSLHPLFSEEEMIAEPGLFGTWVNENGELSFRFEPAQDSLYDLTVTQFQKVPGKPGEPDEVREKSAEFRACLGMVGNYLYLDMCPKLTEDGAGGNLFYAIQMLPSHAFIRVETTKEGLNIRPMNPDWFAEREGAEAAGIPFERMNMEDPFKPDGGAQRIVLTGSTDQLKAFIKNHEDDADLFENAVGLERKQEPPAPPK